MTASICWVLGFAGTKFSTAAIKAQTGKFASLFGIPADTVTGISTINPHTFIIKCLLEYNLIFTDTDHHARYRVILLQLSTAAYACTNCTY
eukprot:SAG11_NODE_7556_length_1129_cov_1.973786_1_plen_91_part_00